MFCKPDGHLLTGRLAYLVCRLKKRVLANDDYLSTVSPYLRRPHITQRQALLIRNQQKDMTS